MYLASVCLLASALPAFAYPGLRLTRRDSWKGWKNIETIFAFGDSYTDTGFQASGTQPSPSNPFGNPTPDPSTDFLHETWISYLTLNNNQSLIETYNLAVSGATVNASILPHGSDLVSQVQQSYLPHYAPGKGSQWKPDSTLFTLFFGINDDEVSVSNSTAQALWPKIFQSYAGLTDQLYQSGARNFLFLKVPPMARAPGGSSWLQQAVPDWNTRLDNLGKNLSSTYSDSNVFVFDTDSLFNQILDYPAAFAPTAGITQTTSYCQAYTDSSTITSKDYMGGGCAGTYEQYFWVDGLHPTFPVHQAIAQQVTLGLQ